MAAITPLEALKLAENVSVIYKEPPFYLTWTFAVCVALFILLVILAVYAYFRISLRNRTNVIIHMPDMTRRMYSYKKFVGDVFTILSNEIGKDGKPIPHNYFFRSNALETGYFGRYIEYDYLVSEPRKSKDNAYISLKDEYRFISGLLNTDLAIDLLLSQKFKDFVKMMLVIIVILIIINIAISIYPLFSHPIQRCSLVLNNETITTIKAINLMK